MDQEAPMQCCVCQRPLESPKTLFCMHLYCQKCLDDIIAISDGAFEGRDLDPPSCLAAIAQDGGSESGLQEDLADKGKGQGQHALRIDNAPGSRSEFAIECGNCRTAERVAFATTWCRDCELGYCQQCLRHHQGVKAMTSHRLLPASQVAGHHQQQTGGDVLCPIHGKQLVFYCRDCARLACPRCVYESHRSCRQVLEATLVAREIKQNVNKRLPALEKALADLHRCKREMKCEAERVRQELGQVRGQIAERAQAWVQCVRRHQAELEGRAQEQSCLSQEALSQTRRQLDLQTCAVAEALELLRRLQTASDPRDVVRHAAVVVGPLGSPPLTPPRAPRIKPLTFTHHPDVERFLRSTLSLGRMQGGGRAGGPGGWVPGRGLPCPQPPKVNVEKAPSPPAKKWTGPLTGSAVTLERRSHEDGGKMESVQKATSLDRPMGWIYVEPRAESLYGLNCNNFSELLPGTSKQCSVTSSCLPEGKEESTRKRSPTLDSSSSCDAKATDKPDLDGLKGKARTTGIVPGTAGYLGSVGRPAGSLVDRSPPRPAQPEWRLPGTVSYPRWKAYLESTVPSVAKQEGSVPSKVHKYVSSPSDSAPCPSTSGQDPSRHRGGYLRTTRTFDAGRPYATYPWRNPNPGNDVPTSIEPRGSPGRKVHAPGQASPGSQGSQPRGRRDGPLPRAALGRGTAVKSVLRPLPAQKRSARRVQFADHCPSRFLDGTESDFETAERVGAPPHASTVSRPDRHVGKARKRSPLESLSRRRQGHRGSPKPPFAGLLPAKTERVRGSIRWAKGQTTPARSPGTSAGLTMAPTRCAVSGPSRPTVAGARVRGQTGTTAAERAAGLPCRFSSTLTPRGEERDRSRAECLDLQFSVRLREAGNDPAAPGQAMDAVRKEEEESLSSLSKQPSDKTLSLLQQSSFSSHLSSTQLELSAFKDEPSQDQSLPHTDSVSSQGDASSRTSDHTRESSTSENQAANLPRHGNLAYEAPTLPGTSQSLTLPGTSPSKSQPSTSRKRRTQNRPPQIPVIRTIQSQVDVPGLKGVNRSRNQNESTSDKSVREDSDSLQDVSVCQSLSNTSRLSSSGNNNNPVERDASTVTHVTIRESTFSDKGGNSKRSQGIQVDTCLVDSPSAGKNIGVCPTVCRFKCRLPLPPKMITGVPRVMAMQENKKTCHVTKVDASTSAYQHTLNAVTKSLLRCPCSSDEATQTSPQPQESLNVERLPSPRKAVMLPHTSRCLKATSGKIEDRSPGTKHETNSAHASNVRPRQEEVTYHTCGRTRATSRASAETSSRACHHHCLHRHELSGDEAARPTARQRGDFGFTVENITACSMPPEDQRTSNRFSEDKPQTAMLLAPSRALGNSSSLGRDCTKIPIAFGPICERCTCCAHTSREEGREQRRIEPGKTRQELSEDLRDMRRVRDWKSKN